MPTRPQYSLEYNRQSIEFPGLMTQRAISLYVAVAILVFASFAFAANTAFDLSGPPIEVKVTRAGKTLPISEVPNLQPGDRIGFILRCRTTSPCTTC